MSEPGTAVVASDQRATAPVANCRGKTRRRDRRPARASHPENNARRPRSSGACGDARFPSEPQPATIPNRIAALEIEFISLSACVFSGCILRIHKRAAMLSVRRITILNVAASCHRGESVNSEREQLSRAELSTPIRNNKSAGVRRRQLSRNAGHSRAKAAEGNRTLI